MTKWKVTIRGTGKLGNSPKSINEVFELDENTIRDLSNSSKKEAVIKGLILTRLPGVEVNVNKLGINSEEIRKSILNKTMKDIGKATIAGAVGGAIVNKISKPKKERKVKNDNEDEFIDSFADELTQYHNISFPNISFTKEGNIKDVTTKLDEIYFGIKAYKWKYASDGNNKTTIIENNRSLTKCLNKFEHGLQVLSSLTEDEDLKKGYKKKCKKIKSKKILNKFGLVIGLAFLFFVLVLIIWITE